VLARKQADTRAQHVRDDRECHAAERDRSSSGPRTFARAPTGRSDHTEPRSRHGRDPIVGRAPRRSQSRGVQQPPEPDRRVHHQRRSDVPAARSAARRQRPARAGRVAGTPRAKPKTRPTRALDPGRSRCIQGAAAMHRKRTNRAPTPSTLASSGHPATRRARRQR
jgi:hypothetical protein